MPLVAILGLSVALFYLGPVTNFFSLLLFTRDITPVEVGFLSYTFMPIAIVNAMNLGFEIFNPAKKKQALIIFAISSIPFYIAEFGWPTVMFEAPDAIAGEMLDISLRNVVLVLAIFYIFSVLIILVRGFLSLTKRITGEDRTRAKNAGLTFFFFGVAAILDTVLSTSYISAARVVMALSVVYALKAFYITHKSSTPQVKEKLAENP